MPCMKLMSASAGVRGRGAAVAGDNILLLCPGAPGCTIGTLPAEGVVSWPDAKPRPRRRRAESAKREVP